MGSSFDNAKATSPKAAPTGGQGKRSWVVGHGVGLFLSLGLVSVQACGGSSGSGAAGVSAPVPAASNPAQNLATGPRSPTETETYPIPPEALANKVPSPSSSEAGSPASAAFPRAMAPEKVRGKDVRPSDVRAADVRASKYRFVARVVAAPSRGESRLGLVRAPRLGATEASPVAEPPTTSGSALRSRPEAQDSPANAPTEAPKSRVPLVEDQPRVRIVE